MSIDALFWRIESFAQRHANDEDASAAQTLMSFLRGECIHTGNPCELCEHEELTPTPKTHYALSSTRLRGEKP